MLRRARLARRSLAVTATLSLVLACAPAAWAHTEPAVSADSHPGQIKLHVDATDTAHRSRHNLAYWLGHDWWGIGPGAHSHVGGVRWWNVKHPAAYAQRVLAGESPAAGREVLSDEDQRVERVLLELRLASGLPVDVLDEAGREEAKQAIADGLLEPFDDRCVLTDRGRLLADAVVRRLLP